MNWDDLRFFLAAVRAGTYSAAATELRVNRTTVARRIAQLEQRLGRSLFAFSGNNYQLTESGRELYQQARQLERLFGGIEESLGQEELSGELRIAAPLGLGPEFLPELAAFSALYPQVRWELINALDPMASLSQRKADIAIAVSHSCPEHLVGHYLGDMSRAIYASKRYLKRVPARTALGRHHWIGWGRDLARSNAAQWMAGHLPADIHRPADVNSWHALKQAVLSGLGVAHLWCFLADTEPTLVRIRPPTPELSMGLWLLHQKDIVPNARLRAFIDATGPGLRQRVR